MTDDQIICSNPACRVSETGKCVEGLIIEECPQYGNDPEAPSAVEPDVEEPEELAHSLRDGQALSVSRAANLLIQQASRIVAVIGPRETGKTSLVAGIYDLFQVGPINELRFARSRTLHAFELACHDARAASRRGTPHTERTRRGEVLFYHLELRGGPAEEGVTLLLADRSGEEYSDVADDIAAADELVEVARADAVTFLIDGERLLDSARRHNLRMDVTLILEGLVESGALQAVQRIALVLTKLDLIDASEHGKRAIADFDALHAHLCKTLEGRIGRFETFKIAASPADGKLKRGTGIDELLRFWLEDAPGLVIGARSTGTPKRAILRIKPLDD